MLRTARRIATSPHPQRPSYDLEDDRGRSERGRESPEQEAVYVVDRERGELECRESADEAHGTRPHQPTPCGCSEVDVIGAVARVALWRHAKVVTHPALISLSTSPNVTQCRDDHPAVGPVRMSSRTVRSPTAGQCRRAFSISRPSAARSSEWSFRTILRSLSTNTLNADAFVSYSSSVTPSGS